jgi:hypothetical protein
VCLCVCVVLAAVISRLRLRDSRITAGQRAVGVIGSVAFALGLLVWLPSGPLGRNWAKRSGTPSALLARPPRR